MNRNKDEIKKKENRRLSHEKALSMEMMFEIVHGQSEYRALRNACKDRELLNILRSFCVCVLF